MEEQYLLTRAWNPIINRIQFYCSKLTSQNICLWSQISKIIQARYKICKDYPSLKNALSKPFTLATMSINILNSYREMIEYNMQKTLILITHHHQFSLSNYLSLIKRDVIKKIPNNEISQSLKKNQSQLITSPKCSLSH